MATWITKVRSVLETVLTFAVLLGMACGVGIMALYVTQMTGILAVVHFPEWHALFDEWTGGRGFLVVLILATVVGSGLVVAMLKFRELIMAMLGADGVSIVEVKETQPDLRFALQSLVKALEAEASYPLGDDRFQISHGDDYFRFFDRMGRVTYRLALVPEDRRSREPKYRAVAAGCGVLRKVSLLRGSDRVPVWYLCDLKVAKDWRGKHLPLRLVQHGWREQFKECPRGYFVSMDAPGDVKSRVVRLSQRHTLGSTVYCKLGIYSLTASDMHRVAPVVERHRGLFNFLDLAGVKDLVMESTKSPMKLLHVHWGERRSKVDEKRFRHEPVDGYTHMFCCPTDDAMASELADHGVVPEATATVAGKGMGGSDFAFILTSDI